MIGPYGFYKMLKETVSEWLEDKASERAAALAYYTIFSIAPLLLIIIAIAGLAFGNDAARDSMLAQLQNLVGQQGTDMIREMLENASKPSSGIIATVIGVITLIIGAMGVFIHLQDMLNTIWEVKPKPDRGFMRTLLSRLLSFSMIIGVGFLLMVSLVVSTALSALGAYMSNLLPGMDAMWQVVNFLISLAVITLLFAMIFKYLPDVKISWSDVWFGSFITALLFTIGKMLIGLYLAKSSVASAYGAAGSFVILLVWIYYAAQIVFFGAEFTQVYARQRGSHIEPARDAMPAPGT